MKIHIYIHVSGSEEIERFEILLDQLEKLEAQLKIDITKLQDALTRESALEAQLEALVQTGADPTLQASIDALTADSVSRSAAMQAIIDATLPPVTTGTAGTGTAGTAIVIDPAPLDPANAPGVKTGN
jgi:hypothetical protein